MSIKYDIVKIRLNEYRTIQRSCPSWETAVLMAIHGQDLEVQDTKIVDRVPPIPEDEFRRLAERYGPKNADTPYVAGVYGNFGPGIKALEGAIRDSLSIEEATDQPAPRLEDRLASQRVANPFEEEFARMQAEAENEAGVEATDEDVGDLIGEE